MGGALWSTWRSVRGIEVTWRILSAARWSEYGIRELLDRHLEEGVAADGTPTGIEHAFRWESFQRDLVVLVSRWREPRGALRLRELYRSGEPKALVDVLHKASLDRSPHPLRARAVDLDLLHELALASRDLKELARRWSSDVRFRDVPLPRFFPEGYRSGSRDDAVTQQLQQRRTATSGLEAELLGLIEAKPADTGQLAVYADWLEQAGRKEDAAVIRVRI